MATLEYRPYAERKELTVGGWVAMLGITAFLFGYILTRKPL